jgi:hypothetical protein
MNEYIKKTQCGYLDLLKKNEHLLLKENIAIEDIGVILDDVGKYWLQHKDCIEKDIDYSTSQETCMILSGAVYLDYEDGDHYLYKALGKYHYLNDSLLKLENIFRAPKDHINLEKNVKVFKKAYRDELLVLRNTKDEFYYVPISQILQKRIEDREELLDKSFWDIISSLFDQEIRDNYTFNTTFSSFEEIESVLGSKRLQNLIYTDEADIELSLRLRIERYFHDNKLDMRLIIGKKTDADMFLTATFSYIGQVIDILITGTYFKLTPYIRFNVTFNYFILIMNTFLNDRTLKEMIERTILTYILYHSIDKSSLTKINFLDYCNRIEKYDCFKLIQEKLDEDKIDITKSGIRKVAMIIKDIFARIMEY